MFNAVKKPAKILLLGGTSEIGLAIVRAFMKDNPLDVVLAARKGSTRLAQAQQELQGAKSVTVIDFDATAVENHPAVIDKAFDGDDVDIAIVAFGVLPDADAAWHDHEVATNTATVNYTAAVSTGVLLAQKFTHQGHGQIIALSSVAGELIRKSNFVYGSTKAGFDGFYRGLGYQLEPLGIKTLVVRSGQVRTSMTAGLKDAPLTVNPSDIADLVVQAVWKGKSLVWSPPPFRPIMSVFRHIPTAIFNKLPL